MDLRLTLPMLLLVTALALTGGVGEALREGQPSFWVEPDGPAAGAWTAMTMTGRHGASPGMRWSDPEANPGGFALIAEDLDAERGQEYFWAVWNIEPEARSIAQGLERARICAEGQIRQATANDGLPGYRPPALSAAASHRLSFTLYALSGPLDLEEGASAKQVAEEARLKSLDRARWTIGGGWTRSGG